MTNKRQEKPLNSLFAGALGDSIDTIEREYVLVTAPVTSTDNLGMSLSASDVGGIQYAGKGISGSPQNWATKSKEQALFLDF